MNKKELLAGATFVTLYTGFIFTGFGWMLNSKTEYIKADIKADIKAEIAPIRAEIAPIRAEIALIKNNQARLDKRMDRIEHRMDRMETEQKDIKERIMRIESMLGQILIAQNIHPKGKGKAKPANKFKKPSKTKPVQRKTASQ